MTTEQRQRQSIRTPLKEARTECLQRAISSSTPDKYITAALKITEALNLLNDKCVASN